MRYCRGTPAAFHSSHERAGEALLVPPTYKQWPARVVILGQKNEQASWSICKSHPVIHHDLFEKLHSKWHGCNSVLGVVRKVEVL